MKDETKSTVTIIEEVCEDICENYAGKDGSRKRGRPKKEMIH